MDTAIGPSLHLCRLGYLMWETPVSWFSMWCASSSSARERPSEWPILPCVVVAAPPEEQNPNERLAWIAALLVVSRRFIHPRSALSGHLWWTWMAANVCARSPREHVVLVSPVGFFSLLNVSLGYWRVRPFRVFVQTVLVFFMCFGLSFRTPCRGGVAPVVGGCRN